MVTVVIPFAGAEGKTRLHASPEVRRELAVAMLDDVVMACRVGQIGPVRVVTPDELAWVEVIADPGGGQGAAVAAALVGVKGPILVVNADLPCVTAAALQQVVAATPALVPAADGTTNALSLASAEDFVPLYGPGSAARFQAHTGASPLDIPDLADDVDTMDDLERLELRLGPETWLTLQRLRGSLV